jgi:hypothetical protein
MMQFHEATVDNIILHRVGNKMNEEGVKLSKSPLHLDQPVKELLLKYFLSPFRAGEFYNLWHESDLGLNAVYTFVSRIFDDPDALLRESVHLAKHLYEQSSHPKIKSGEFYAVYIKNCTVNGTQTDAVGLFKSESRETYLRVFPKGDNFEVNSEEGININKLDKGCIIFNSERENGFLVSTVDTMSRGAEAHFWKDDFLKVKSREDNYFHTQNMINLCKRFVTEKLPEEYEISKADQADLLNKSANFLKENDTFDLGDFGKEVIQDPKMIKSFKNFKNQFEDEFDLHISNEFDISETAVKRQSRFLKSVIKLDKNFHIYVHGSRELIVKGVDKSTGMNYYQLFFQEEN